MGRTRTAKVKNVTAESPHGGSGVSLLGRGGNIRSDAKLVARLLACGCIDEAKVEQLLQAAVPLAARSAQADNPRGYAATMGVLISSARLGLQSQQLDSPQSQVNVQVNQVNQADIRGHLLNEPEYIEWLRSRACEADSDSGAVRKDGIVGTLEAGEASGGT